MEKFVNLLKDAMPQLNEVTTKNIQQAGFYLYFKSFNAVADKNIAIFQLIIADHSSRGSILPLIENTRAGLRELGQTVKKIRPMKSIDTLIAYTMDIHFEFYDEVQNSELLSE